MIEFPRVELLDAAAEIACARRIEAGVYAEWVLTSNVLTDLVADDLQAVVADGRSARQELYLANLRLAACIARQWAVRHHLPVEELFQEGCLGLGEAIWRWDHTRGVRFATVAWSWVSNRVARAAQSRCGELQAPQWFLAERREVLAISNNLANKLGRQPTRAELGGALGRPLEWVERVLAVSAPTGLDEGPEPVAPEAADDSGVESSTVRRWLAILKAEERRVVEARHGLGRDLLSVAEIAVEMGCSQTTVRRIEERALGKLRRHCAPQLAA